MSNRLALTDPQYDLVTSTAPYPALVAGYASGKSHALITRAMLYKFRYPSLDIAYYFPTYDLVNRIGYPRFEEWLTNQGVAYKLNKADHVISFPSGGNIIFRTMDTPSRIVGYEVADSFLDELDTIKTDQARNVWQKVMARNRQKKPDKTENTIAVGTTPEGFGFVYEQWKKTPAPGYQLIKASTYSNAHNLPDGFIDGIKNTYPSNLLSAYLDGEFVNLTAGSVYPDFDRTLNASRETIKPGEPLHIGMDFNVTKMAAVVFVLRDDIPHAVSELTGVFDTPAMISIIKSRYKDHSVIIYPDASGSARKTANASQSDLSLLHAAGFRVCVDSTNPAVRDRVLAVNIMINGGGVRKLCVNVDACPALVEALEKQAYDKNSEPDKMSGLDHVVDAAGYMIAYRYPVARRSATILRMQGQ